MKGIFGKKGKRAAALLLSLSMLFLFWLPSGAEYNAKQENIEDKPFNFFDVIGDATDYFVVRSMEIIEDNQEDNYIMAVTMELGKNEMSIDGRIERTQYPAVVEDGELMLPAADIAGAIGADLDAAVPDEYAGAVFSEAAAPDDYAGAVLSEAAEPAMSAAEPVTPVMTAAELEEAICVEIRICDDTVIITKPYQLKQIILYVKGGGKLADFMGAEEYATNGKGAYFLQYPSEEMTKAAYERYANDPLIQYVTINTVTEPEGIPDRWGAERVGIDRFAEYLIESGKTDKELIIAQVDTGLDASNAIFKGRLVPGYNFYGNNDNTNDVYGHGTHIGGVIVDSTPPNVKLMPIKSLDDKGFFSNHFTISNGIKYAADHGAKVINLSVNGECAEANCLHLQAIEYAWNKGVISVAAAGNKGKNASDYCPSKSALAITVSASDKDDCIAGISNYGNAVDLAAPGVGIVSVYPGNKYASMTGTSVSAAYVSAGSAMLTLEYPDYSPKKIKNIVKALTTDYSGSYFDYFGTGILSFDRFFPVSMWPTLELDKKSIDIRTINEKYTLHRLTATLSTGGPDEKGIAFTSDNPNVAVCREGGIIEIKGNGYAQITAESLSYGVSDVCEVTVDVDDSMFWISRAADGFAGGDGSREKPYQIANAAQLALMAKNGRLIVKGGGLSESEYFELTNDVDLSGREWIPLGYTAFYGHFNGNGHKITNMRQSKVSEAHEQYNFGLFGIIGGEVKNLGIENAAIFASPSYAFMSGILASSVRGGAVSGCYTTGESSGSGFAGIITGLTIPGKTGDILRTSIKDCYSTARSTGFAYIVSETDMTNCYYQGAGNFITQTHAGTPGIRVGLINCFMDNSGAKTSYFIYIKNEAELANCYYTENGNKGVYFDISPALTKLAARPAEFFRNYDTYADGNIWDERFPWNFDGVWGIDRGVNGSLPYLKYESMPGDRVAAPGFVATDVLYGKVITIKCDTVGAQIYYTTDETNPIGSGKLYTGAGISLFTPGVFTIRAVAVKEGMEDSQVAGLRITVDQVAKPIADPPSGVIKAGSEIRLNVQTTGAYIYYTTDGKEPYDKSTRYASPIKAESNMTLKAIAYKTGMAASEIAAYAYEVAGW